MGGAPVLSGRQKPTRSVSQIGGRRARDTTSSFDHRTEPEPRVETEQIEWIDNSELCHPCRTRNSITTDIGITQFKNCTFQQFHLTI